MAVVSGKEMTVVKIKRVRGRAPIRVYHPNGGLIGIFRTEEAALKFASRLFGDVAKAGQGQLNFAVPVRRSTLSDPRNQLEG